MQRIARPLLLALVLLSSMATWGMASASDGTVDVTASARFGTGFNDPVSALALQTDGKILVGGSFTSYNGTSVTFLVRLNSDGTLDSAFRTALGSGFDGGVNDIAIQGDGKIIVVGGFDAVNGVASKRVVRLNADGTVDSAFSTSMGTGLAGGYACGCAPNPKVVVIQADDKILLGGDFDSFNGQSANGVVRLTSAGALDTAFVANSTAIFDYVASDIALQSDGKILVAGAVSGNNQAPTASSLVRLNVDGSLDTAFNTALNNGTGLSGFADSALAVAVQADGKIVVGGNFSTPSGVSSGLVARYSSAGAIDSAFSTSLASGLTGKASNFFYSLVSGVHVMSTGEIVVTGSFTTAGGVASPWLARLTSTGAIDSAFSANLAGAANERISDVVRLSDGSYLVAGWFTRLGGRDTGRIAVLGNAAPATTTTVTPTTVAPTTSAPVSNVARSSDAVEQRSGLPTVGASLAWLLTWSAATVGLGAGLVRRPRRRAA